MARDIAHAKLLERVESGEGLPEYIKDHIIYYAGPAKTPDGMASGSFGPTTVRASIPASNVATPVSIGTCSVGVVRPLQRGAGAPRSSLEYPLAGSAQMTPQPFLSVWPPSS